MSIDYGSTRTITTAGPCGAEKISPLVGREELHGAVQDGGEAFEGVGAQGDEAAGALEPVMGEASLAQDLHVVTESGGGHVHDELFTLMVGVVGEHGHDAQASGIPQCGEHPRELDVLDIGMLGLPRHVPRLTYFEVR